MDFSKLVLRVLIILVTTLLMAAPFALEFLTFQRNKEKKISYKGFRVVVCAFIYVCLMTVAMSLLKDFWLWLGERPYIQQIVSNVALSSRTVYCGKVFIAILANFAIGLLYRLFSSFVRIGLTKKNLTEPKKNGAFSRSQKIERGVIKFFHKETWFFVGSIVKYLSVILSIVYALVFIVYQIPAMFGADWLPYSFISMLFDAGYIYPTITLLAMWEIYFFLAGIQRLEEECEHPEQILGEYDPADESAEDLRAIADNCKETFKDYYVCDLPRSPDAPDPKRADRHHHHFTESICEAIRNDGRNNPQGQDPDELYLDCLDRLVESEDAGKSVLINGVFFSEFSMYFCRYLSAILARGDNIAFVCNSDNEIEAVHEYLTEGFSALSSLYVSEKGSRTDAEYHFDDPIWKIVKIHSDSNDIEKASVNDSSILVTSLGYLCSDLFDIKPFVLLLDTVVLVDSLKTVNIYGRQLAMLNNTLRHITQNQASLSQNESDQNKRFKVRYMSKQVRYICFDDTSMPGLDKVLKNLLESEDMESVHARTYHSETIVRCYNYEGTPDQNGRRSCPQLFHTNEVIDPLMNMAAYCVGAPNYAPSATVFVDETVPYENIKETIGSHQGSTSSDQLDVTKIRLNKPFYHSHDYSVIIALDSGDNLPAALRKYLSMVGNQPALLTLFSRPYMLRDYYIDHMHDNDWRALQWEEIPVETSDDRDVAQRILLKANAGGISEEEIKRLVSNVERFREQKDNIQKILEEVLRIYDPSREENEPIDLYQYFEYATSRGFDENGTYRPEDKVLLRRQGSLFDMINGRDMVTMIINKEEELVLSLPKNRLTQNYIEGQNILYNGNTYHIDKVNTSTGQIEAHLATGGMNTEAYRYVQDRNYRIELNTDRYDLVFQQHVRFTKELTEEDVVVREVHVYALRAPMEVDTKGYYRVDPLTGIVNIDTYIHNNDESVKQTYRRYGDVKEPFYRSEAIMSSVPDWKSNDKSALMMLIRISGRFGENVDRAMMLAAVMLNELLHTMFPSVADSVVVCPVLHGEFQDAESGRILPMHPHLSITGDSELASLAETDFELAMIEDCAADLGVVSVLRSRGGEEILHALFGPIFKYLKWYHEAQEKSRYLYYGLDHEPVCFDFASLYKLSKLLGDQKYDLKFVNTEIEEHNVCCFCGKRYVKGDSFELDDGRKMCRDCARNLVENDQAVLKSHLERARIFLESAYGITLEEDYEFCFESTVKITNTLKQHRGFLRRGADIPLKSFVDDKKKVHVEYSVPSVSLSELLVRELTHVWQLKHLSETGDEDLAEGHIALVAIQYLRFLNQDSVAATRKTYYESTSNSSGVGYRKLVHELLKRPQLRNNPFRYLLEISGGAEEERETVPPNPEIIAAIEAGDYSLPYTPEQPDRALDGHIPYFYYSNLNADRQEIYDMLYDAIRHHTACVTVTTRSADEVQMVINAITYDHPELFWYKACSVSGSEVTLIYGATVEESVALQQRIDEATHQYLDSIMGDAAMSAYDAAIRIHAKIIASVDYDTIALNRQKQEGDPVSGEIDYLRTICGVFLDGKAVCEGYARAMQYLLQKCGIEAAEVAGYIHKDGAEDDEAHAWNIVKIDGDYYQLDTTWDDRSNTIQSVQQNDIGFNYFCITTEEMSRTRDYTLCPIEIPNCSATKANYFYHNDFVIDRYDLAKIKAIAQASIKNTRRSFTFKCRSKDVYDTAFDRLCVQGQDCYEILQAIAKQNPRISSSAYSYTYDKNIWTITVKVKLK